MSDRDGVIETLTRYATAVDERKFERLRDVFLPDLEFERVRTASSIDGAGGYGLSDEARHAEVGRETRIASIEQHLTGCGPTQHLLGNFEIHVTGDTATSRCNVRAFHVGDGPNAHLTYEVFGSYHDQLVRTPDGWRISSRRSEYSIELGSASVVSIGQVETT